MIDSISIRLQKWLIKESNLIRLLSIIRVHQEVVKENGQHSIFGTFKCFTVGIHNKTVTIHGSLPMYYFGNNVQTLSYKQTKAALYKLQEELQIPLLRGELARVDVSECFFLNDIIAKQYFQCLLPTPDYHRTTGEDLGHNVKYVHRSKPIELTFYNKTSTAVRTPEVVVAPGQFVVRIELRIKKNVRRLTTNYSKKLAVFYLLSPSFHKTLAQYWLDNYTAVIKRRSIIKYPPMKFPKEFVSFLLTQYILERGVDECYRELEIVAEANKWNPRNSKTVQDIIQEHFNSSITTLSSPIIKENDPAVFAGYIAWVAASDAQTIYNAP